MFGNWISTQLPALTKLVDEETISLGPGRDLYRFTEGGQVVYVDELVDLKDALSLNADGTRAFVADVRIGQSALLETDSADFAAASRALHDKVANGPLTSAEVALLDSASVKGTNTTVLQWVLQNPNARVAPEGFTWHHDLRTGEFHLVHSLIHSREFASHVGGAALYSASAIKRLAALLPSEGVQ